jgi:outer membrane protein assembly factor BamB
MRQIPQAVRAIFLCAAFMLALQGTARAQSDWLTYRHDFRRSGVQPVSPGLSNIFLVRTLHCAWSFGPADAQCGVAHVAPTRPFFASPIIVQNIVLIGDTNGVFYALDAETGTLKWQYPKAGTPRPLNRLNGSCDGHDVYGGWGTYGVHSSASYAKIGGRDAVIFGAPDPDPNVDGGAGSGRLWAVDIFGDDENRLIWKSEVIAHVEPKPTCDPKAGGLHERIANSTPLVLGNKVYVGVHDTGDDPLQQGRVSAVDLLTGKLLPFSFVATGALGDGSLGGGVWNSPATDGTGIFFTTGNTRCSYWPLNCPANWVDCCQPTEPSPNYGLSMIRVDKDTGKVIWNFQPVPFRVDQDPDWAAGATLASASCGDLVASVQKDGWAYALNAADKTLRWQFPDTGVGSPAFLAAPHDSGGYRAPGAVWKDALILTTGGEALVADHPGNYGRLHALNLCASVPRDVVRWIADLGPPFSSGAEYSLGAPTVAGGYIYIGTDLGHLLILGDPDVLENHSGDRCSNPDIQPNMPVACDDAGYRQVPNLTPRFDLRLDGGDLVGLRKEVVLFDDRIFVSTGGRASTGGGHVYMLATARLALQAPEELLPGHTGNVTVYLSRSAPVGGAVVTVTSDPSLFADLPSSVTIPAGQTTTSFTVRDAHTGAETGGRIFGSYSGETAAVLINFPQPPETCDRCTSPRSCCICSGGVWVKITASERRTAMRGEFIALAALPLLCSPAASEEAGAPTDTLFEATTKNVDKNGAARDVRVTYQVWRFPGQGEAPQELPLRGFYIAHLLGGEIAATIDGQTVKYSSGAYWSVKPDATMWINTIGQLATIETIVAHPVGQ